MAAAGNNRAAVAAAAGAGAAAGAAAAGGGKATNNKLILLGDTASGKSIVVFDGGFVDAIDLIQTITGKDRNNSAQCLRSMIKTGKLKADCIVELPNAGILYCYYCCYISECSPSPPSLFTPFLFSQC